MAQIVKIHDKDHIVTNEDGEVLGHTHEHTEDAVATKPKDEPEYVKLYIEAWCAFKASGSVNSKLVCELLPFMTWADKKQRIVLAAPIKREIAAKLGWSEKTALTRFSSEMSKLCKAGLLKSDGSGVWQVNPELVGKGYWSDIKALRATFTVIGDRAGTVDVSIENNGEGSGHVE